MGPFPNDPNAPRRSAQDAYRNAKARSKRAQARGRAPLPALSPTWQKCADWGVELAEDFAHYSARERANYNRRHPAPHNPEDR